MEAVTKGIGKTGSKKEKELVSTVMSRSSIKENGRVENLMEKESFTI